jgi:hypothetical protein
MPLRRQTRPLAPFMPGRQRASESTVTLTPAVEAPHREGAVRLDVVVRQAVETKSNKGQGNRLGLLRRRAMAPATVAPHLVESVGIWILKHERRMQRRGGMT